MENRHLSKYFQQAIPIHRIKKLSTDQHSGVGKLMRENYPNIKHTNDIWHVVKNLKKRLTNTKRPIILKWIPMLCNHMWFCINNCNDDENLLKEMWLSTLQHITNKHRWRGFKLYKKCSHSKLSKEEKLSKPWIKRSSKDFNILSEIVTRKGLLSVLPKVSLILIIKLIISV